MGSSWVEAKRLKGYNTWIKTCHHKNNSNHTEIRNVLSPVGVEDVALQITKANSRVLFEEMCRYNRAACFGLTRQV